MLSSNNRFVAAVAVLFLLHSNQESRPFVRSAEFRIEQLEALRQKQAQTAAMLALFDDNNFEKEFVDTTNDHDTMPLDEQQSSQASFEGPDDSTSNKQTLTVQSSGSSSDDQQQSKTAGGADEEESMTEVAARAKKEMQEASEKEQAKEEQKSQANEAKEAWQSADVAEAAEEQAVEKADKKKEQMKNTIKSVKEHNKNAVFKENAFKDKDENDKRPHTVQRDPKLVQKEMHEIEKIQKSIDKINSNIGESKKALEKHQAHVKELKEVIKQQNEGSTAKAELDNVLANAQKHVTELESHIKKGENLIDEKEHNLSLLQSNINRTNIVEVKLAKEVNNVKKLQKQEKKLLKQQAKAKAAAESIVNPQEAPKKKSIEEVTINEIKHDAIKAEKNIGKQQIKAIKAENKAKELIPEVKKAKAQVKKLEALTAQTKEGSVREEQMKNFTAKAKERLADVEQKVNKQLTKELKAKSEITKSEVQLEKAKEEYKEKREDLNSVKEAELSAQGLIHSKPGSSVKPPHVVEGENAVDYIKYVNQSQESFKYYHVTPYDAREWHKPEKTGDEPQYSDQHTMKPVQGTIVSANKHSSHAKQAAAQSVPNKHGKKLMIRKIKPISKKHAASTQMVAPHAQAIPTKQMAVPVKQMVVKQIAPQQTVQNMQHAIAINNQKVAVPARAAPVQTQMRRVAVKPAQVPAPAFAPAPGRAPAPAVEARHASPAAPARSTQGVRMSHPIKQASARPLHEMMPHEHVVSSYSSHESDEQQNEQEHMPLHKPKHQKHKKKKSKHHKLKKHKKARKHHRSHKKIKARKHHTQDELPQTQSAMSIQKKHRIDKKMKVPSKDQLMKNPQIQKLLKKNNLFWEHEMDSTISKFKNKIEKVERLYQRDESDIEKEHKAFLKKLKNED